MLQTKEKRKSEQIFSVILTVLLLAFLGLVFYVNLSCNPEYYDGDIYADIEYAKQAWKAKSLFPQNWVFGNQTYVVATPALAAIIYGIINNAVLAMGIASCIMTVLLVLTYDWMLKSIYSYNERTAGFLSMAGLILIKDHIATGVRGGSAFLYNGELLFLLCNNRFCCFRLLYPNSAEKVFRQACCDGSHRRCAQLRHGYAKPQTNGSYGVASCCL